MPVSSIFRKQANTPCIPRSICAAFPKQTAAPVSEKRPASVFYAPKHVNMMTRYAI